MRRGNWADLPNDYGEVGAAVARALSALGADVIDVPRFEPDRSTPGLASARQFFVPGWVRDLGDALVLRSGTGWRSSERVLPASLFSAELPERFTDLTTYERTVLVLLVEPGLRDELLTVARLGGEEGVRATLRELVAWQTVARAWAAQRLRSLATAKRLAGGRPPRTRT